MVAMTGTTTTSPVCRGSLLDMSKSRVESQFNVTHRVNLRLCLYGGFDSLCLPLLIDPSNSR